MPAAAPGVAAVLLAAYLTAALPWPTHAVAGKWTGVGMQSVDAADADRSSSPAAAVAPSLHLPCGLAGPGAPPVHWLTPGSEDVLRPLVASTTPGTPSVHDYAEAALKALTNATCAAELVQRLPSDAPRIRALAEHQLAVLNTLPTVRSSGTRLFHGPLHRTGVVSFALAHWLVHELFAGLLDGSWTAQFVVLPLLLVRDERSLLLPTHPALARTLLGVEEATLGKPPPAASAWPQFAQAQTSASLGPFPVRHDVAYAAFVGFDYDLMSLTAVVFRDLARQGVMSTLLRHLPVTQLSYGAATGVRLPLIPPGVYPSTDDGATALRRRPPGSRSVWLSFAGSASNWNDWHGIRAASIRSASQQLGSDFVAYQGKHWVRLSAASEFVLAPPGAGPQSYRVYEALAVGAIPVIVWGSSFVGDGHVPLSLPYAPAVDWCTVAVLVHTSELPHLAATLHQLSAADRSAMRLAGAAAYAQYFTADALMAHVAKFLRAPHASPLRWATDGCVEYPSVSVALDMKRDDGYYQQVTAVAATGRPTEQAAWLLCVEMGNLPAMTAVAASCQRVIRPIVQRELQAALRASRAADKAGTPHQRRCAAAFDDMHTAQYRDVVCGRRPPPWWTTTWGAA